MIYTTYFDNLKSLPDSIIPISICLKTPDWYDGLQYKKLAPRETFFHVWRKTRNNNYYIDCFNEQVLKQLNIDEVILDIKNLISNIPNNENKDIALVCYELPCEFCHRHLVSQWLNQKGTPCIEWDFKQTINNEYKEVVQ